MKTVTRGWPKETDTLPCIAVALAGSATADRRDDARYLTEMEYYVRIFAATQGAADALAERVEVAMATLGYEQTFAWEDSSSEVRQLAMRYKTTK